MCLLCMCNVAFAVPLDPIKVLSLSVLECGAGGSYCM